MNLSETENYWWDGETKWEESYSIWASMYPYYVYLPLLLCWDLQPTSDHAWLLLSQFHWGTHLFSLTHQVQLGGNTWLSAPLLAILLSLDLMGPKLNCSRPKTFLPLIITKVSLFICTSLSISSIVSQYPCLLSLLLYIGRFVNKLQIHKGILINNLLQNGPLGA